MKRRSFLIAAALILILLFPTTALAVPSVTAQVSPSRAQAGDTVTISGTYAANQLLSIKITDEDSNIVLYNAVRAGADGAYQQSFKIPDLSPQTLTVVAGSGSTIATTHITVFVQQYCTVTFDKNGGDTDASPKSVTVKQGEAISSMPSSPAKAGHSFGGWYKERECQNAWSGTGAVTSNITVYAKWVVKTYAVKFFCSDGKTQIGHTQTVYFGDAAKMETAPPVSGFLFDRWVLTGDDDSFVTSLDSVRENITATASYVKATAPTATPSPTAKQTNKPTSAPTATPSSGPTDLATTSPTANSSSPGGSVSPASSSTPGGTIATTPDSKPVATIVPTDIDKDDSTGTITVTIKTGDLPEGTGAIQLPDGTIVKVSGDTTVLKLTKSDLDKNGSTRIVLLSDNGTPLGSYAMPVQTNSGIGILFYVAGGLLVLCAVLLLLRRRKKRS